MRAAKVSTRDKNKQTNKNKNNNNNTGELITCALFREFERSQYSLFYCKISFIGIYSIDTPCISPIHFLSTEIFLIQSARWLHRNLCRKHFRASKMLFLHVSMFSFLPQTFSSSTRTFYHLRFAFATLFSICIIQYAQTDFARS